MQTTIAADKSGKSQLKRMAGASPAVILVMLHVKFPLRPSRGGHKQLSEAVSARVRYKMFSRSAGAFRTQGRAIHRFPSQAGCQQLQSEINELEVKICSQVSEGCSPQLCPLYPEQPFNLFQRAVREAQLVSQRHK